jgi:FkbM family methyltransferase
VGANIGFFTLRVKQIWPQARVVAVEPHPGNFSSLQEHIELNQLKDVTALQKGVTEQCGCFDLYLSPRNIAGHSMYKKTDQVIQVQTCTLTDVMTMLGPRNTCDLLKIDCEGCEYPLLTSLTQEVANRIGCIIFEPEPGLYNVDQLSQKLTSLGYRLSRFSNLVIAARA